LLLYNVSYSIAASKSNLIFSRDFSKEAFSGIKKTKLYAQTQLFTKNASKQNIADYKDRNEKYVNKSMPYLTGS
jgi:hypothetical protein